ncbi:MAG: valine--tRNA ligase [Candidatus Thermoplasmatota archaeon]|nr:valine--tRNA ligase [Candidatus Thermoplasmatota archaeon]
MGPNETSNGHDRPKTSEAEARSGGGGYDFATAEERWQRFWEENSIYRFDPRSDRPPFVIDNPPRYASGPLHAGHAVHYTHIDFAARYKRMRGYNVMFPLCFDVNGMPIEVRVEKKYNIRMRDTERHEFTRLCEEFAQGNIAEMTRQFRIFGESMDPSVYYQTDAKYYRRLTQISFIKLFHQGRIYKANHPVNWCPRCGTALAESEVEYQDNVTKLNTILFEVDGEPGRKVEIATTRPELLCTCQMVAVHPQDERYSDLVGRSLITPVFGKRVPVIADDVVERTYGSGVVMICTIGDKEDLRWVFKYGLTLEKGIDEHGRMTELAGRYAGMDLRDARKAIIEDMRSQSLLVDQKDNPQNVGTCWRCHATIEFLQVPQWFLRILDIRDDILKMADEIEWHPEFMKVRLREWVNSLSWDWVISRQRYFATPIPVWECLSCGHAVLPDESDCYVDPTIDTPPVKACPECGGELKGSEEVFDTWMDSSISPLYCAFWLRDDELFGKLYPVSLRPQSHDIIRTWAFYTMVRSLYLTGKKPWSDIMMGGFIMSPDGTPMHASKGNAVDPLEYHTKYGADAIRYYAATCTLGKDHPFRIKDVERGSQITRKLYNMQRLISSSFESMGADEIKALLSDGEAVKGLLHPIDSWMLDRLSQVVSEATDACENYAFDKAVKATVDFMWLEVADQYLEMVKTRIRKGDPSAVFTLYNLGLTLVKLLAPFMPHIAEEVFQAHYVRIEGGISVHISDWPRPLLGFGDRALDGAYASEMVSAIRRYKSEKRMALGASMGPIRIITEDERSLEGSLEDIRDTLRASELTLEPSAELHVSVRGLKPVFSVVGPMYRDRMKSLTKAMSDPEKAVKAAVDLGEKGKAAIDPGDGLGEIVLTPEMAEVQKEWTFKGRSVDHIALDGAMVLFE